MSTRPGGRSGGRCGRARRSRDDVAVTTRRSRSGTGQPGRHETPVIWRASEGEIGAIEPLNVVGDPRDELGSAQRRRSPRRDSRRDFIEKSGWSDSNRRPPAPKRALYQAELHPVTVRYVRHSMTVCTDELALRRSPLAIAATPRAPVYETSHLELAWRSAREMIPVHRSWVEIDRRQSTQGASPSDVGATDSSAPGATFWTCTRVRRVFCQ